MRVKALVTKRMKSGPSQEQMEKKNTDKGKRSKSPQLSAPKYGKTKITVPPNQACAWKQSKLKDEGIQVLVDAGLLQEKALASWNATAGDAWPMEKNPDGIPMFAHFIEHGLALPASDFFRGMLDYYKIEHVHLNPNSILHITIFVHFCEAFLGFQPH